MTGGDKPHMYQANMATTVIPPSSRGGEFGNYQRLLERLNTPQKTPLEGGIPARGAMA
jgi:hypothetical protein